MIANDYQHKASRTLIEKPDFQITDEQVMITWTAMGLAGEAGEVAELVKKGIYHQKGIDRETLKNELGDVLWYLSGLAHQHGITLDEIMQHNISKLEARYPDGYDHTRSGFKKGKAK